MKCACGCGQNLKIPKYSCWQKKFLFNHWQKKFLTGSGPGKKIPCQICNKIIYRAPWQFKRNKTQTCSIRCHAKLTSIKYTAEGHPNWKGGKTKDAQGYIRIRIGKRKYIAEHRFIAEKKLRRPLRKNEVSHHINGIKIDNRPKNLKVMTNSIHTSLHHTGLRFKNGYKRRPTPIPLPS